MPERSAIWFSRGSVGLEVWERTISPLFKRSFDKISSSTMGTLKISQTFQSASSGYRTFDSIYAHIGLYMVHAHVMFVSYSLLVNLIDMAYYSANFASPLIPPEEISPYWTFPSPFWSCLSWCQETSPPEKSWRFALRIDNASWCFQPLCIQPFSSDRNSGIFTRNVHWTCNAFWHLICHVLWQFNPTDSLTYDLPCTELYIIIWCVSGMYSDTLAIFVYILYSTFEYVLILHLIRHLPVMRNAPMLWEGTGGALRCV